MEFDSILNEKIKGYILQKKIDGVYWYEGNFKTVQGLANACFELGQQGVVEEVKITVVTDKNA